MNGKTSIKTSVQMLALATLSLGVISSLAGCADDTNDSGGDTTPSDLQDTQAPMDTQAPNDASVPQDVGPSAAACDH